MNSDPQTSSPNLLKPIFWPLWVGLGILRLCAVLPYDVLSWLGPFLGRLLLRVAGRRRHIAATNLRLCFPQLSDEEHRALLKTHFETLGMSLMEAALAWWAPPEKLRRLASISGLEHLEAALAEGKGVILLGAHYTTLEISGPIISMMTPHDYHLVYRPHENPLLDKVVRERRSARIGLAIARDDMKSMLRALKRGKIIWFASDQNYGLRNSVFSPFFGIPAATNTAPSRLAKISGAKVVPFVSYRRPNRAGYALELFPALENFPTDDVQYDIDRVNQLITEQVKRFPDQYLWVHRRFKDRPPGEADFYAKTTHA